MVTQVIPQGAPWCVLSLLSRGILSPNSWDTGPYRWEVGPIQFFKQFFEHGFGFFRQPFHSQNAVQLGEERLSSYCRSWPATSPLAPLCLSSPLLSMSWHKTMVRSVQTSATGVRYLGLHLDLRVTAGCPVNQLPHGSFPHVLDTSLHGGPLA